MFSSSTRSSKRVGRIFVAVVLALLSMAIFAGLEAWGAGGAATPVAAAALTVADSGHAALARRSLGVGVGGAAPQVLDVVSSLGREAVRVLTTMITAVFEGWWQPVDAALDWVDGVRRGWSAVHRFPGPAAPRS